MTSRNISSLFKDPGNRGPALLAVSAIATGIALIFTIVRIFVRIRIVKTLGWDDMCIAAANIFAILLFTCYVFEVHEGVGMHEEFVSPEQVERISKWNHLDVLPIVLSAVFTRISICFFLRRFFRLTRLGNCFSIS